MRAIFSLLLILGLAGCQRGGRNNTDAIRQGVIDHLAKAKFDVAAMDIKVGSAQFHGDQADANAVVTLKGKSDAPPMNFRYHLERQANKWVVVGLAKDNAHGGGRPIQTPPGPIRTAARCLRRAATIHMAARCPGGRFEPDAVAAGFAARNKK